MATSSNEYGFAPQPKATGALRWAPLGTPAPVDGEAALDAAYIDLGYIGEEGFTETLTRDTEKKKAFGGATFRVLQTDFGNTFQFTFLHSSDPDVLRRLFGEDNVTVSGSNITVAKNKKQLGHGCWVIDTEDGPGKYLRTFAPDGQIIEIDDITRVPTDTVQFTVTFEAFEDATGNTSYDFHYRTPIVAPTPSGATAPKAPSGSGS